MMKILVKVRGRNIAFFYPISSHFLLLFWKPFCSFPPPPLLYQPKILLQPTANTTRVVILFWLPISIYLPVLFYLSIPFLLQILFHLLIPFYLPIFFYPSIPLCLPIHHTWHAHSFCICPYIFSIRHYLYWLQALDCIFGVGSQRRDLHWFVTTVQQ